MYSFKNPATVSGTGTARNPCSDFGVFFTSGLFPSNITVLFIVTEDPPGANLKSKGVKARASPLLSPQEYIIYTKALSRSVKAAVLSASFSISVKALFSGALYFG